MRVMAKQNMVLQWRGFKLKVPKGAQRCTKFKCSVLQEI